MSLTLRFLGTSASRPTVERNVSSIALVREGETLMFDCGEGTQRQMMRYGISFALSDIFFTHMHADHMLGVTGLLRTLALQGRTEPMNLYGPPGSEKMLWRAITLASGGAPKRMQTSNASSVSGGGWTESCSCTSTPGDWRTNSEMTGAM